MTTLCCAVLACCMLGLAWGPLWAFIPLTCVYGLGLGLLYPLLAAAVYDRSTPTTRSINSNVMMATFDASGMLGPLLGGLVIHAGYGYRGVFTATAVTISLRLLHADRQDAHDLEGQSNSAPRPLGKLAKRDIFVIYQEKQARFAGPRSCPCRAGGPDMPRCGKHSFHRRT